MKELSLSDRIRKYLRRHYPAVINGGELERLAMQNGYKASNCSRRCRELAEEGIIEVTYSEKGFAEYKYKQTREEIISLQMKNRF